MEIKMQTKQQQTITRNSRVRDCDRDRVGDRYRAIDRDGDGRWRRRRRWRWRWAWAWTWRTCAVWTSFACELMILTSDLSGANQLITFGQEPTFDPPSPLLDSRFAILPSLQQRRIANTRNDFSPSPLLEIADGKANHVRSTPHLASLIVIV